MTLKYLMHCSMAVPTSRYLALPSRIADFTLTKEAK
jgi:hypothetical protein